MLKIISYYSCNILNSFVKRPTGPFNNNILLTFDTLVQSFHTLKQNRASTMV